MNDGKKSSKLDKLLLGVVIGGAVGSVVGATLSNKDNRRKIMEKAQETSSAVKKIIDELSIQLRNGNTIDKENRVICKGGTVKWISVKAQLFKEENEDWLFVNAFKGFELEAKPSELRFCFSYS